MKPILFNTEMVRAILEGRKTVTRRIAKTMRKNSDTNEFYSPIMAGDVLYVRETWGCYSENWGDADYFMYRADYPDGVRHYMNDNVLCDLPKWKPSIHMPKEAARIFLRVTDVRLERLQDITEEQAEKEGCQAGSFEYKGAVWGQEDTDEWTATEQFAEVWQSTIKKNQLNTYGWFANPYVWVIGFERITEEEAQREE